MSEFRDAEALAAGAPDIGGGSTAMPAGAASEVRDGGSPDTVVIQQMEAAVTTQPTAATEDLDGGGPEAGQSPVMLSQLPGRF